MEVTPETARRIASIKLTRQDLLVPGVVVLCTDRAKSVVYVGLVRARHSTARLKVQWGIAQGSDYATACTFGLSSKLMPDGIISHNVHPSSVIPCNARFDGTHIIMRRTPLQQVVYLLDKRDRMKSEKERTEAVMTLVSMCHYKETDMLIN
jgi:hypothetical protein